MSDLDLQKFSDRLDAAAADGTLTREQARLAKAALEGAGMEAAIEVLQASETSDPGDPTDAGEKSHHEAPVGLGEASAMLAEDLAALRDALNADLGSDEGLALIQKIAAASVGRTDDDVGSSS